MLMFITITALEFGFLFHVRLNGSVWMILLMMLAAIPSIYGLGFAFASLVLLVAVFQVLQGEPYEFIYFAF